MDTIQLIISGIFDTATVFNICMMFFGVLIGIIFGAIPGLTTNLAVVLFLPVTYGMDMLPSMLLLLGIYCGGTYGGSITAILISTPGTNTSIATMFDGAPLAQEKKQPGKALHMALYASTIGGLVSAVLLLIFAPVIADYILLFGPPEYFALAVLGLSVIAGVSGKNLFTGIAAGAMGALFACVGIDAGSGVTRFAFGNIHMTVGLSQLAVMLGLFAIPNIMNKIRTKQFTEKIEYTAEIAKADKLSKEDKRLCRKTIWKSTAIGSFIGAVPAAGAAIASMIAYNEAKRTSKRGAYFGTGELEGVAAPEAANNAVTGTSLIPLFTLGIPGSVVASILVGAFTMNGLQVGPTLFRNQVDLMYGIMVGMIFCNIFLWAEGKFLRTLFIKVAKIPQPIMVTALTLFCVAGSFSESALMFDVYVMLVVGIAFYFLNKLGLPMASFILGFILGPMAESNLKNSLVMADGNWTIFVTRPISLVILLATLFFTIMTIRSNGRKMQSDSEALSDDE